VELVELKVFVVFMVLVMLTVLIVPAAVRTAGRTTDDGSHVHR
jgi:hypothetical protein